jgi:hypothetical protein
MPLNKARSALLHRPDVCDWVKMADKYMTVYLAERRRKTSDNKLSRDETNQLLEEFWDMIDRRIETEGVPAWDE